MLPSGGPALVVDICHIDTYRSDHEADVDFIPVSKEQTLLPPAPRFIFGRVPQHIFEQLFGELFLAATGCYVIRNGRLISDAIVLHREAALWSNTFNHPQYYVKNVATSNGLHRAALPIRRVPGRAAVVYGPGYPVYGHWLVDFLPRLHVLQQAGFNPQALTFVLPYDLPLFGFELMRLVGIPEANILRHNHDKEQLQFDELVVPTILRSASRLHPDFAAASRNWIKCVVGAARAVQPRRRLYVSRSGVKSGRVLSNRKALEDLAVSAGYEVVRPETLSLEDQIALFRDARSVIGEYGSGLHSTVFGAPSLASMVLRGTSVAPGFVQSGLAEACWQSIGYVFGDSDAHAVDYEFQVKERDFELGLACMEILAS